MLVFDDLNFSLFKVENGKFEYKSITELSQFRVIALHFFHPHCPITSKIMRHRLETLAKLCAKESHMTLVGVPVQEVRKDKTISGACLNFNYLMTSSTTGSSVMNHINFKFDYFPHLLIIRPQAPIILASDIMVQYADVNLLECADVRIVYNNWLTSAGLCRTQEQNQLLREVANNNAKYMNVEDKEYDIETPDDVTDDKMYADMAAAIEM